MGSGMDVHTGSIREILSTHGNLAVDVHSLAVDAHLFDHGMSSFQAVQVMMAVEEHFGLQFPDEMIRKETFSSIRAIADAVAFIQGQTPSVKRAV